MDAKLKKLLETNKIKYQIVNHKKVYTAFNEAETQHMKPKEIAKTVLLKAGKEYILVVIPSQKYVDFKKVQKTLVSAKGGSASGGKKVSMAKESDIAKILKTKIGLIHPFGNLFKLPVFIDRSLLKQKRMVTSAGSYTESIGIKPKDFEKLALPVKGNFSK